MSVDSSWPGVLLHGQGADSAACSLLTLTATAAAAAALENYLENIHGSFDFEVNPPYLMYTHGNAEVRTLVQAGACAACML